MRVWTTADHPIAEQFPYWREVLCEAFTALNPVADLDGAFLGRVARKDFADVTICDVASHAQRVSRRSHEIRRVPSEYFFANLQLRGSCVVHQDGRETTVGAGDFCIVDTTRPYTLTFDDWHVLSVRVPRPLLMPLLRAPQDSTARCVRDDGGLGTIAGSYIRSLAHCSENVDPAAQQTLIRSLAHLISAALGASPDAREQGRAAVRQGLRETILAHVENRLADPALSTATVAARFRVSVRYLQKLFEEDGTTFSERVLDRRLSRCARELIEPGGDARPIAVVADRWGFADASSFCRAFRRRYGVSAGEYRRTGRPPVR